MLNTVTTIVVGNLLLWVISFLMVRREGGYSVRIPSSVSRLLFAKKYDRPVMLVAVVLQAWLYGLTLTLAGLGLTGIINFDTYFIYNYHMFTFNICSYVVLLFADAIILQYKNRRKA